MSSVRQYQRRALEDLKPEDPEPLMVDKSYTYYLDGEEIYFCDISKGVGTCANLWGINIAVFGKTKPDKDPSYKGGERQQCEWAAISRPPTSFEKQQWLERSGNTCCWTVQRIGVVKQTKNSIHFTLTKDAEVYAYTI